MGALFTAMTSTLSAIVSWIPDVIGIFTENDLLLFFIALSVVGILIGIVRSLVRGA